MSVKFSGHADIAITIQLTHLGSAGMMVPKNACCTLPFWSLPLKFSRLFRRNLSSKDSRVRYVNKAAMQLHRVQTMGNHQKGTNYPGILDRSR